MENGTIVGQGKYDELIQKTGDSFANYIKTYLDTKETNKEDISKTFEKDTKYFCKYLIVFFSNFFKRNFAITNFPKVTFDSLIF